MITRLLIKSGIFLVFPSWVKWRLAHRHHRSWKLRMLNTFGEQKYFKLYDEKALIELNQRFKVGTNFIGKTVVDVGCGVRGILGVVKAAEKIGIDPTISEIKKHFNLPSDITFISAKAEKIPIPDSYADIVACINTLNHVENPSLVLDEIKRIMKPDAIFLFEVYFQPLAPGHPHTFSLENLRTMFQSRFKELRTYYLEATAHHELTGEEASPRWGGVFIK